MMWQHVGFFHRKTLNVAPPGSTLEPLKKTQIEIRPLDQILAGVASSL